MENPWNYGDDDIFDFRFQNEFDGDLRFDSGAATPKLSGLANSNQAVATAVAPWALFRNRSGREPCGRHRIMEGDYLPFLTNCVSYQR
jgi:hypothetical protein